MKKEDELAEDEAENCLKLINFKLRDCKLIVLGCTFYCYLAIILCYSQDCILLLLFRFVVGLRIRKNHL